MISHGCCTSFLWWGHYGFSCQSAFFARFRSSHGHPRIVIYTIDSQVLWPTLWSSYLFSSFHLCIHIKGAWSFVFHGPWDNLGKRQKRLFLFYLVLLWEPGGMRSWVLRLSTHCMWWNTDTHILQTSTTYYSTSTLTLTLTLGAAFFLLYLLYIEASLWGWNTTKHFAVSVFCSLNYRACLGLSCPLWNFDTRV